MATVSTYLNLEGNTEEAFDFYRGVFGGEFLSLMRMGDAAPMGGDPMPDDQKDLIMHVALPILGGHLLMGTDATDRVAGNTISIMLQPDHRDEADRLFAALAEGGTVEEPMKDQFWGDYYGSLRDPFGVPWMVIVEAPSPE